MSQAAPYHHFVNKDGLLAAIAADGFGRFTADQEAVRAAVPDPIERLRAMGRLYVMRAQEPPNIIRLMVGKGIGKEAPPPELRLAVERLLDFVRDAVSEYLESIGRLDAVDVNVISVGSWSLVHGVAQLLNDGRVTADELGVADNLALVDAVVDVYIRGVQALAASSTG